MSSIWNSLTDGLASALTAIHGVIEPAFGVHSWGWSIIVLTIIVRLVLTPLTVKQTKSMRAMQHLSPKIKAIQKRYAVSKEDRQARPEEAKKKMLKQQAALRELYASEGVNPAGGCLPLLLQMPIMFALFSVLRRDSLELVDQPFYFFTDYIDPSIVSESGAMLKLGANVSDTSWPGFLLLALMGLTMAWTAAQTAKRGTATPEQAKQQKIMAYGMAIVFPAISFNFPVGLVMYWVTSNIAQAVTQSFTYKLIENDTPDAAPAKGSGTGNTKSQVKPDASDTKKSKSGKKKTKGDDTSPFTGRPRTKGHLPGEK